jgi:hypothetical protein
MKEIRTEEREIKIIKKTPQPSSLRHYATSRKVVGSIPDMDNSVFQLT